MATPNRVGSCLYIAVKLRVSHAQPASRSMISSVDMGSRYASPDSSILTGLFDGDLSSPCYKDRRRILVGLFSVRAWWVVTTSHTASCFPSHLRPLIILAAAGLRLLIREDHSPYFTVSLPWRPFPTFATRGTRRSLQDSLLARSAWFCRNPRREPLLNSLDLFSIAVE